MFGEIEIIDLSVSPCGDPDGCANKGREEFGGVFMVAWLTTRSEVVWLRVDPALELGNIPGKAAASEE